MSDYGLFESDEASQAEPRLAAKTAARKLEAAVDVVRAQFGRFLLGATGIDEFGDRWHYSKNDIRAAVEPYVFPNTGTMRRIQNAMKQDWKLAHPYKLAEDRDAPIQNLQETFHPSDDDLIPEGNFEGYKDSVDQNGPSKVESNDFVPGKEAARLVADIYTDFAQSNGLRVASLDTLDIYASTGIHEADYRLLESMIVRAAECEDDEDDDDDSEAPSASESDESDSDDESDEAPDFGGGDDAEGDSDEDESDDDSEESDESDSESGEAPDFGGSDEGGAPEEGGDDFGGPEGGDDFPGGEQFTVPEHAPELDPQLQGEIPQDDPQGAAPIPPEVIDSLLGLPEGTIEQLLLEEVQNQGLGGGEPEPPHDPRLARRFSRHRLDPRPNWTVKDFMNNSVNFPARDLQDAIDTVDNDHRETMYGNPEHWDMSNDEGEHYPGNDYDWNRDELGYGEELGYNKSKHSAARYFWAAEDEQSGGDSGGGEQPSPAQDPAAMGGDPSQMGGGMLPPPGSQAVQPPAPAQPLENQPAEDALLDTANQAIMQMIDRETQEYQQIIAPLTQALQAVQFAQQVEQTENPMDVTPPDGTVNVNPSMAPGGAQNPQQQLARLVRKAKKDAVVKNAARLIARTYGVSESMLREAMGRRQYEHAAEAFQILPEAARQDPHVVAAASHIAEMFHANDGMFNKPVFLQQALGSGMARAAGTERERYQNKAYSGPRDKRRNEHGQQDLADAQAEDEQNHWEDDPDYQKLYNRNAFRGRLPFDQARAAGYRQAGETWKNTSTMDAYEAPKAGQVPEITDNLTINDLPQPQYKGLPKPKKNTGSKVADLGSKVQKWFQRQVDTGLNMGGDAMAERYITEHKAPASQRGIDQVHQVLNVNPHPASDTEIKTPKPVAPKAVNPVTKKGTWGEWEPTKEASFFTRKVPGWRWDDHLSGYISKEGKDFTCSCGQKVAAPSYKSCDCGKIWNITALGSTQHLASDTADFYVAREIPVRPGVILAGKNMESVIPVRPGVVMANKKMVGNVEKSQRELEAMIDKMADWTKYDDDVDPAVEVYGKSKPASTDVAQPPKDWAKRKPAGDPGKKGGTWTPPSIPRKKK